MIKLLVEKAGQYFVIIIDNKVIKYWDNKSGELWGEPLQYLPPDPNAHQRIKMSRNRIPAFFADLLFIPKWEIDEFEKAKDDAELKILVMRDLQKNGCKVVKDEEL